MGNMDFTGAKRNEQLLFKMCTVAKLERLRLNVELKKKETSMNL